MSKRRTSAFSSFKHLCYVDLILASSNRVMWWGEGGMVIEMHNIYLFFLSCEEVLTQDDKELQDQRALQRLQDSAP